MANITNNEVVTFCNDFLRITADKKANDYYFSKKVVDRWNSLDMSNKITNNSNDYIVDSAFGTYTSASSTGDGDGRPVIDGTDCYNLYTRCSEIITDYENSSNAKLNTIINVAVNLGE